VVEIETPKGFAYAQRTHNHPTHGDLIRVLPGLVDARPSSLDSLVAGPTQFVSFYALDPAIREGWVDVVGTATIPDSGRQFPTFRNRVRDPRTGRIEGWWLWDGRREWSTDSLTDDQLDLPLEGVINHPMLVSRVLECWTPRRDTSGPQPAGSMERSSDETPGEPRGRIRHFLYFNKADHGDQAKRDLESEGFDVDLRRAPDGEDWRLVVSTQNPDDLEAVRRRLEQVAKDRKGEYDGWEAVV
jgi:hypothetical protein